LYQVAYWVALEREKKTPSLGLLNLETLLWEMDRELGLKSEKLGKQEKGDRIPPPKITKGTPLPHRRPDHPMSED
jgi:hypothetical protein